MKADIMVAGHDPISVEINGMKNNPDTGAVELAGDTLRLRHGVVWELTQTPTETDALPPFTIIRSTPGAPESGVVVTKVLRITNAPEKGVLYMLDAERGGGFRYIKHSGHFTLRLE